MNSRRKMVVGVIAALVVGAIVATGAMALSSSSSSSKSVVKTGTALGKKVLVTRAGMTLYSLSAEWHSRFICKDSACLALWKPLVVAKGMVPTGAAHLTGVKRPDGRRQVAYRGAPLYTFTLDKRAGQVKGNGFKDVGVWRPATVSTAHASSTPPSTGGGYGYGP